MTAKSITNIRGCGNRWYAALPGSLRPSPCHGGELRGLCSLLIYSTAHQYDLGARQLCAFQAALRGPCSVLQSVGVSLQISILLQKADPIFSLDLWYLEEMRSQGLLAHNRCDARGAFPSPCIEAETLLLLSKGGEEWTL
jgi:hypothetical protein